ncbi:Bifunctional protein Aas [Maioricimonas rarisocia]|uniref:Bifunctional protein Aas n=1 Tax=Maioricimonas rarisocia TaxID=2528026 RepID=A0A517Z6N0_9PLAN|nr:acyl-[ACP]--phospholipid O-acyltransferase [Maioricimonas rarisocia]QDU38137.1 Bifunctional protein Aas [Maioricimonas rarisocia]
MTNTQAISTRREGRGRLTSQGYLGLLATQFLGAFNDNMLRWLAVPIGQRAMDPTLALTLGGISFVVPYLILAPMAGSFADRFSKRSVILACKLAEVVIVLLAILGLTTGNIPLLFAVVAMMGGQTALFAPAKFGSLPELLTPDRLSAGNGYMGLATVVACALGGVAGYQLYGVIEPAWSNGGSLAGLWPAAAALLVTAVAGVLASLPILRVPAADPARKLELNPVMATWPALRQLWSDVRLARTALGIGFFWSLAALAQLNIDQFGSNVLGLQKQDIGMLLALLVAGVGTGSVLAGWWSGGKVELGIVPLGAIGLIVSSIGLFVAGLGVDPTATGQTHTAFVATCIWLFLLGISGGLFSIPLDAYLQHRSDEKVRGTVLAGSNFVAFSMMLVALGAFYVMHGVLGLSPGMIFLLAGLSTIPVAAYILKLMPDLAFRCALWLATKTVYRLRVYGRENVPEQGGAVLVANHVSFVDGVLLLVSSSRLVRFIVYADYTRKPGLRLFARIMRVIPIRAADPPRAIIKALQTAREAVQNGEVICIFAEGQLTRTGQMQSFQPGIMKIVKGTGAPVVPVYLHGLWGSVFSYRGGRFFWKRPQKWPYPVSIHIGKPLIEPQNVHQIRQSVEQLGVEAYAMDQHSHKIPVRQFIRQSKRASSRTKVADSTGMELTGGRLLAGSLAMHRVLKREVLADDEMNVGVLLPPAVGGAVANLALALGRRVAVNLNYTMSDDVIDYCVEQAGIRHVLTSRRFLEKRPTTLKNVEFVFLEDLKEKVTAADKAFAAAGLYVLPASVLERMLGLHRIKPDDLLTIIFTSGSTGVPKGVMLSHRNIASNLDAVDQLLHLTHEDALLGVLPFFHSFGYTVTLWLPLAHRPSVAYHFNPLDARTVGKLCEKYKVTLMLATPTFLKNYLKRIEPKQLASVDMVVVGAEKLPLDLAAAFEEKFGIKPTEGYGTTELSPVAAVNVPDHRSSNTEQIGTKMGTVGRPVPGVAAKVICADTGEDLGIEKEGMLMISGPNVMLGYLNEPEKTAEVVREGWYFTGDCARLDKDGFIEITGRQSRFSKIGGEMVPHIRIEAELARIVEDPDEDEPELKVAVTAVSDERKGEKLIVLHKPLSRSIDEIRSTLRERGFPNLWIPAADAFVEVDHIPILGSGKLDLRELKRLAEESAQASVARTA